MDICRKFHDDTSINGCMHTSRYRHTCSLLYKGGMAYFYQHFGFKLSDYTESEGKGPEGIMQSLVIKKGNEERGRPGAIQDFEKGGGSPTLV